MLELVEHIADWAVDAPILVACMARPELLEVSPGWGGGKLNATSISLEPLTPADLGSLVTNLLAVDRIDPTVRDRIVQAAEGHPLFAEETLAMLVEQGRIVLRDETWVAAGDLAELAVPPTTSALISARIDQLDGSERITLQRAAVIGQLFYRDALIALAGGADPGHELSALTRKQFIHPERSDLPGTDALAFRHLMIRDAAYEGIPKAERADLHERFADWLERAVPDRLHEYDEILGFHLERAWRYREELGQTGDRERAIGIRAAAASRARRAGRRPGSTCLRPRVSSGARSRARRWRSGVPRALVGVGGRVEPSRENEGAARADRGPGVPTDGGDVGWSVECGWTSGGPTPSARIDRLRRHGRRGEVLIPELERSGDDLGLTKAWQLVAERRGARVGRVDAGTAGRPSSTLGCRRPSGRERDREHALRGPAGPAKPRDMLARYAEVAAEGAGDQRFEAQVLGCEAVAHAMLGEFELARSLLDRYREIISDLGIIYVEFWLADTTWFVEMLAGDAVAAEAGIRIVEGSAARRSGRAGRGRRRIPAGALALAQGRYEEAAESLLRQQDLRSGRHRRSCGCPRAPSLQRGGRTTDLALARAREAVALAETMDDLNLHGDALMALAEVLLAGRAGVRGGPGHRGRDRSLRTERQPGVSRTRDRGARSGQLRLMRTRTRPRDPPPPEHRQLTSSNTRRSRGSSVPRHLPRDLW